MKKYLLTSVVVLISSAAVASIVSSLALADEAVGNLDVDRALQQELSAILSQEVNKVAACSAINQRVLQQWDIESDAEQDATD